MKSLTPLLSIFVFSLLLLAGAYFIPWKNVSWGTIKSAPAETVVVTGYAEKTEQNQVASFNAGVTVQSDNRDQAVEEVNQKVSGIIEAVKNFGIDEANIQTQNLSINRQERPDQPEWRVSNNIQIEKVPADRAGGLADLLSQSEATDVYGPNFQLETARESAVDLLDEAIADARQKAEKIAAASNKELGEVISVTEGIDSQPRLSTLTMGMGGGGAPVQPGTTPVSQTVTVVFALK